MDSKPSVAIIGAGLAGLTCGTALKGMVERLKIFEKSIFPGGRISRFRAGEYEFNHGAQYFTVNHPLFWNIVSAWQSEGIVRPWDGWIVELQKGQIINSDMVTQRFIGVPRMQTIVESLARHCDLSTSTNISELEHQESGGWRLFNERGDYQGAFDIVIIATAAQQVAELCGSVPAIGKAADNVDMTVCWSAMFAFDRPLNLPYDAAFVLDSPLSWISRYQLAAGDAGAGTDCWVLHASPEWSQQYAASFRGRVMNAMLHAFWEAVDLDEQKPASTSVHCWKHALPINPISEDSLFDDAKAIGACGDWCTSPRIEGAVLSGFSMADRVMKYIRKNHA
ncbi:MAG: NAD(P)-binding protein [Gammaproteobacteria bacterium]|nr:NAD(P)-binding protein [Gammaproteobacteria bacterium]